MDPKLQRGYLNNNPGNIDRGRDVWQGEIRDPNDSRLTDFQRHELTAGRFCVFSDEHWGIRAIVRNLLSYQHAGWNTIDTMIDEWAPPNENNTAAYKQAVCASTGKGLHDPIEMADYKTAYAMVDAIIKVELGGNPYTTDEMEDGLRLAGVVKPVTVATSTTAKAATVASGSTVAATVVSAASQPIQQVADQIEPFAGTSHIIDHILLGLKIALAVAALASIGIMIWERVKRERRDQKIDANPSFVGQ